jgi:adenine deaminase
VIERHGRSRGPNIGLGFVRGLGLARGSLASSVAHDSHNLIVAGVDDEDMACAANALIRCGGGQVAAASGQVLALLPLPVAGLLSLEGAPEVVRQEQELERAAKALGCKAPAPFMALSFLALPVIGDLKLTDLGLVDVGRFKIVPLWVNL